MSFVMHMGELYDSKQWNNVTHIYAKSAKQTYTHMQQHWSEKRDCVSLHVPLFSLECDDIVTGVWRQWEVRWWHCGTRTSGCLQDKKR